MRHMGGCTECHTIWWGCRCPLRCEECGAGYRDDSISNCNTPGCNAGLRRRWAMQDRWREDLEASRAEIECEAVEPAPAGPETQGDNEPFPPSSAEAEMDSASAAPSDPEPPEPERGSQNAIPSPKPSRRQPVQNGQARKPTARSAARPASRPDKPAHRPVAERRAAVETLLAEGLSDREIARRSGVSPSTVSTVRKAQETAKIGA